MPTFEKFFETLRHDSCLLCVIETSLMSKDTGVLMFEKFSATKYAYFDSSQRILTKYADYCLESCLYKIQET